MDTEKYIETYALPEGVTATTNEGVVTFKGPKGEASKSLSHPLVNISVKDNEIVFQADKYSKVEKKLIKTFLAHVKNFSKGVLNGCVYKLKICSGHFPMNVSMKGNVLEIKNFIGETVPRTIIIKEGVDAKIEGSEIVVTGVDKELTSQMAASIEKLTRRNNFDKRIFQDGIYIIEKNGKKIE